MPPYSVSSSSWDMSCAVPHVPGCVIGSNDADAANVSTGWQPCSYEMITGMARQCATNPLCCDGPSAAILHAAFRVDRIAACHVGMQALNTCTCPDASASSSSSSSTSSGGLSRSCTCLPEGPAHQLLSVTKSGQFDSVSRTCIMTLPGAVCEIQDVDGHQRCV